MYISQLIWTCMFPFPASPRPEWCSDGQTEGGERGPQGSGMNWSSIFSGPYKCQNLTLIFIFCLKIVFTLFKLRMNSFPFFWKSPVMFISTCIYFVYQKFYKYFISITIFTVPKVIDLNEQVQSKTDADDAIMVAVNNKVEEWKVSHCEGRLL